MLKFLRRFRKQKTQVVHTGIARQDIRAGDLVTIIGDSAYSVSPMWLAKNKPEPK